MTAKYFSTLSAIILATVSSQPLTPDRETPPIMALSSVQIDSALGRDLETDLRQPENAGILLPPRDTTVLVSRKKDPSPPREPTPGGSR